MPFGYTHRCVHMFVPRRCKFWPVLGPLEFARFGPDVLQAAARPRPAARLGLRQAEARKFEQA